MAVRALESHVSSMHRSTLFIAATILVSAPWVAVSARGSDASCEPVFAAMEKLASTPAHIHTTETAAFRAGGKPTNIETIYSGGAIYVRLHDKWIRSNMTTREMLGQEKENRKTGAATCVRLPDEQVDGASAFVFRTHEKTEDRTVVTQTWISKTTGLLLRQDVDIDVGGKLGKSQRSSRYEYGNVRPPA